MTTKELKEELVNLRTEQAKQELLMLIEGWKNKRIRLERRKLEEIINSLPVGVSIIGDDYKVQLRNKWMEEKFKDKPQEICYESHMNKSEPRENCPLIKSIAFNKTMQAEITTKDGRCYGLIASPIGEHNGKRSGIEIIIDLTEQRWTEQALIQSQQKYADLVESLNVGIYQTTPDTKGHFCKINPALVSMFEASSKEQLLRCLAKSLLFTTLFILMFLAILRGTLYQRDTIVV